MIPFCLCVQLKTYSDDRVQIETWKIGFHQCSKDTHLSMLAIDTSPLPNMHFKIAKYHSAWQSTLTTYFLRRWEMSLSIQKITRSNTMKPVKKQGKPGG